ncbi:DUF1523 family protein [Helicobacter pylori]|uniref:DUF1523 family protein n=1 Tax=Helicobacter pylori TaxID=210 RepID=UPI0005744B6A|nr:DUF1523 family protein [Helicobacter pylori]KHL81772.1 hypothetical protein HPY1786_05480 [Helicobacter pylori]WQZ80524.1 DUF1523 family protein [Helicobacter pylori]WRF28496.1 DUF1523 family protein [Helicobacter pylori]
MIKFVRNVVLFILTAIFLALMLLVSYCMPHYSAAVISGVEVKRMNENENTPNNKEVKTLARDVYFVQTYDPKDQKSVTVYRNEDTRFGFPFYFKFNSADISALAQSLVNQQVEVQYYGWRINLFNMFPNVIFLKPLKENAEMSKPVFSWILYALLLGGFFISVRSVCALFKSKAH